jgi:hypothetical protein
MKEFDARRKVLEFVGGETWDTALWMKDRDDGGNLTVKVRIKVCLRPVEVKTGPGSGWYQEEDDRFGTVGAWERLQWEAWKREYCDVINDYWSGTFWLKTPDDYDEFNIGRMKPNVRCDLSVNMIPTPGGAHLSFNVIRVADYRMNRAWTGGPGFTGWRADLSMGSDPESEERILNLGELAHIMGMPHQQRQYCNHNRYFKLQSKLIGAGSLSVMAKGAELDGAPLTGRIHKFQRWQARLWQLAMEKHTGVKSEKWKVETSRIAPTFLPDKAKK